LDDGAPPIDEENIFQASCEEPQISLLALSSFLQPQTLNLIGYIKHHRLIALIDSDNTHNFIHRRVAMKTHCYFHPIPNFQIMIANEGMMKYVGRSENVKLQMGGYHLKTHMFVIDMGGHNVVLKVEWLCTLGHVTMDLKDLYASFTKEGHKYTLEGLTYGSHEIITSHSMEKLLKKGHSKITT
jgi:hypothetical protein